MKIGFNCSTFDLLHAGHVTMLKEEKRHCDYLIAALMTDPTIDRPETKNKPVQSVYERYTQLQAVRYVDEIIVYETEDDLLDRAWGLEPNSRLSCQAILAQSDVVIEIPKYTINHAKENH